MLSKVKLVASSLLLAIPLATLSLAGCQGPSANEVERWATTENTNVKIDWDKVNQAYKDASGPDDLEKRINEIYEGDEVISIAVQDEGTKTQVVTGFFDKNTSGSVDEGEKIFTIKRELTGEGQAQYQTAGYGPYYGYTSPMFSIASGMLMGAMLSNMFMPSYVPMYTRPYTTHPTRAAGIREARSSYRSANPERFQRSKSGRSYNRPSSGTKAPSMRGGGKMGGGGRFGLARAGRTQRPRLLEA